MSEIERAAPDDAPEIARLVNLAYEVERFFVLGDRTSPDRVRAAMETGTFLVVRDGAGDAGRLLACIHVETARGQGRFGMLAVDPARERQGWGGRLIEAAEAHARDAGCRTMEIRVVNLREDLLPRYRRLGYHDAGTEPYDHRPTVQDCFFIVMRKDLVKPRSGVH